MSNKKIVNYYLLCTARLGAKIHIVDEIPDKKLNILFTKKEIDLFLRKHDGHYIAREIVVGGNDGARQPVMIIN